MRHSKDLPVVISNLTKAKNFISDPRHWAKGEYLDCDFTGFDHKACAIGALDWIRGTLHRSEQDNPSDELCYLNEAMFNLYHGQYDSIIDFNDADETTHARVMQLFDEAIVHAEWDLRFCNAAMSEPAEQIAFTAIEPTTTFAEGKAQVVQTLERLGITVTAEIE